MADYQFLPDGPFAICCVCLHFVLSVIRNCLPGDADTVTSDNNVGMLRAQDDCSCGPWRDITGCDDRCVNTESRACSPVGCAEEYRIQSGFCCVK